MTKSDRKNGSETESPRARTRGGRFAPGNPGRPKGSRNRTTLAVEALIEGEAEALTKKAIELGKSGDLTALRLCLERIAAPRRDRPCPFELPTITDPKDNPKAIAAIIGAVAAGDLTASEAEALCRMFESYRQSVETAEILSRLESLEAKS